MTSNVERGKNVGSRITKSLSPIISNVVTRASNAVGRVAQRVETSRPARRFVGGAVPRPEGCSIRRVDPIAEVDISYEPHPDGKPDPGEVVWLWLPYVEQPSIGKDRPGLVIGWIEGSGEREVAVIPLTSKFHRGQLSIGVGPWDGSRRNTYAKIDQVYAVSRSFVRREGATLPAHVFAAVVKAAA
jgi:PemK-like, MazF-like toxin of type II toxin-antitoxin system